MVFDGGHPAPGPGLGEVPNRRLKRSGAKDDMRDPGQESLRAMMVAMRLNDTGDIPKLTEWWCRFYSLTALASRFIADDQSRAPASSKDRLVYCVLQNAETRPELRGLLASRSAQILDCGGLARALSTISGEGRQAHATKPERIAALQTSKVQVWGEDDVVLALIATSAICVQVPSSFRTKRRHIIKKALQ
jgi:hypothetical protein